MDDISYKMCAVKVRNAKLRNYLNMQISMEFSLFLRSFPYRCQKTISPQREVNSGKKHKHSDQKLLRNFTVWTQIWLRILI
jgi:hypothetical protein